MPLKRALAGPWRPGRRTAGPWRQHFDDELRLRQNHWKIIGKPKKSGFCVVYSVAVLSQRHTDNRQPRKPGYLLPHGATGPTVKTLNCLACKVAQPLIQKSFHNLQILE
jgi:hypothetical protein